MESDKIRYDILKKETKMEGDVHVFERAYTPINDEGLLKLGVEIRARTTSRDGVFIRNALLFVRDGRKAIINCIHTVIGHVFDGQYKQVSSEKLPSMQKQLRPEEHYFALKSFIQSLIEKGIQNTLFETFEYYKETNEYPIDMNPLMISQIFRCLIDVAPSALKKLIIFSLETLYLSNPVKYMNFFMENPDFHLDFPKLLNTCDLSKPLIEKLLHHNSYFLIWAIVTRNDFDVTSLIHLKGVPFVSPSKFPSKDAFLIAFCKKCKEEEYETIRELVATIFDPAKFPLTTVYLANDANFRIRLSIAKKAHLSIDLIDKLSKDHRHGVREMIAKHLDLPNYLFPILARDAHPYVRCAIASHPDLSVDLRDMLMEDPHDEVRSRIVLRDDISVEIIRYFCSDKSQSVIQWLVAKNHSRLHGLFTDSMIIALAQKGDSITKEFIASSLKFHEIQEKNVKALLLPLLENSYTNFVRENLMKNPTLPSNLFDQYFSFQFKIKYIKHRYGEIQKHLITRFLSDNHSWVRYYMLFYCESIPLQLLPRLVIDPDPDVREELASKMNLPYYVYKKLINDRNRRVRIACVKNKSIPPLLIESIIRS